MPGLLRSSSPALWTLVGAIGCAHTAAKGPGPSTGGFIDDAVVGPGEAQDAALAELARGDLHARVVRLDRLLDLFDAARFGGDEAARETLWNALGGHATGTGPAATRDAQAALLGEAMALDEPAAREGLSSDDRQLVAGAIMLLTNDLQAPGSADDVVVRTLAFRTLTTTGHPRVADNARWRLYDHARGTLRGATEAAPGDRIDVAVQALYVDRESVEPWLTDTAPHAKPPVPSLDDLWATVTTQTAALAEDARWQPVMARRRDADAQLHDTLAATLPAPRRADWPVRTLPTGTAAVESYAPVLRADGHTLVVDDGRPDAQRVDLDGDPAPLVDAVRATLAADGRGIALWVADPALPAPRVDAVLQAVRRAGAAQLELAVYEARLRPDAPPAVLALPLQVVRDGDDDVAASATRDARLQVHLAGRGTTVAIDGRVLPLDDDATRFEGRLDALAAGFPGERLVRLTLGPDVQLRQLVELLADLRGRGFAGVAWDTDGTAPAGAPDPAHAETLARRATLGRTDWRVEVTPPFAIKQEDQARIEAFVESLTGCLTELEQPVGRDGVTLTLPFDDAALGPIEVPTRKGVASEAATRLRTCLDTKAHGFRLRHHRDRMKVAATITG